MNHVKAWNFRQLRMSLYRLFKESSHLIHSGTWQGVDISAQPAGRMHELLNVTMYVPQMPLEPSDLAAALGSSVYLPWAEDHFQERVCGFPLNPGDQWDKWRDGQSAARFLDQNGQFNHNYMERFWPKYAGAMPIATKTKEDYQAAIREWPGTVYAHEGIRHGYGDLEDVVQLLLDDPLTRQAYLPMFFPEDTGTGDGGRKPCTLGYQFIVRDNLLHIYYPMRSCDFYRHWGDDVYMAIRLASWVLSELQSRDGEWKKVSLGSYSMHCTSLHMFVNDLISLDKEFKQ